MATIIAGMGTSHTPAIGAALDLGKTKEPYWVPIFEGYEGAKQWMAGEQAGRGHHRLQRPRQRLRLQDHPDLRHRLRPTSTRSPTRDGARARCRWSRATPRWPPTSPSR
ncbi:MAG: hypothetical protein WDN45_18375 [Caulobacteraceae bacterium]